VDDNILALLLTRQLYLLAALERRGHAATAPLRIDDLLQEQSKDDQVNAILRTARAHPEWSTLNPGYRHQSSRQDCVDQLADRLQFISGHNVPVLVTR